MPRRRTATRTKWEDDPAILARLRVVERLHTLNNLHPAEIVAELNTNPAYSQFAPVAIATVHRDLVRLRTILRRALEQDVVDLRAQRVAELDDFKRMMVQTYEHAEPRDQPRAIAQAIIASMHAAKLQGIVVDKLAATSPDGGEQAAEYMHRLYLEAKAQGLLDEPSGGGPP